ncbi:MAG TPA: hypothetical protein VN999_11385 [Thermoanaerobaculia bacterium]|nr:hypothetical protein [Thermoanaerobaculia bacterium]
MSRLQGGKPHSSRLLQGLLACAVVQAAAAPALANISLIAPPLQQSGQVSEIAYDQVSDSLYFLDFNGALKSLQLNPACEAGTPASCASPAPVTSFSQPTSLAVNGTTGFAYVTDFDRVTSKGALWRVDLKSKAKAKVQITALPGLAHGIVLAPETNSAYIVGQRVGVGPPPAGHLWRVDLSTVSTGSILSTVDLSILPQALVVNSARTLAYVLQANPVRFVTIDLATGKETGNIGNFGQTQFGPYSLAWTDSSETTLYALIGNLTQSALLRVDPAASTASLVATFATGSTVPVGQQEELFTSGGLAVNPSGSGIYVGSDHSVVRFPLGAAPNGQAFSSIGYIPVASIDPKTGKATTAPPAQFQVVDAPFGGTLDIFGDLLRLRKTLGATHYRILVSPGRVALPPPTGIPIVASWTTDLWTQPPAPALGHYVPTLVAPDATGLYSIPTEYADPLRVPFWRPPYLMMRWPTSDNGLYTLQIQIFNGAGTPRGAAPICPSTTCIDISKKILPNDHVTVLVDNTLPVADLRHVLKASGDKVDPCTIVSSPDPNSFTFDMEVSDGVNDHLLRYALGAVWGRNQSQTITSDSYPHDVHVNGSLPNPAWKATCNCAHFFTLTVSKRTTNGYRNILSSSSSQSITINNTGQTCP